MHKGNLALMEEMVSKVLIYLQKRFVLLDKKFTIRVINYSFIDPSEIIIVNLSKRISGNLVRLIRNTNKRTRREETIKKVMSRVIIAVINRSR